MLPLHHPRLGGLDPSANALFFSADSVAKRGANVTSGASPATVPAAMGSLIKKRRKRMRKKKHKKLLKKTRWQRRQQGK